MGKRFTETEKWRDPWFRKLSVAHKAAWFFLTDNCDATGLWKIDIELMEFQLGVEIDWPDFVEKMDGRVIVSDDEKAAIIPSFISFQYGKLSEDCRAHFPVFKLLSAHEAKGYQIGYSKGINTLQEEEKEKESTKEGSGEEKPAQKNRSASTSKNGQWVDQVIAVLKFDSNELREALENWVTAVRRPKKAAHTKRSAAVMANKLKPLGLAEAVAQIDRSANAGWTDVYPENRLTDRPLANAQSAKGQAPTGWQDALRDVAFAEAKGDEALENRIAAFASGPWEKLPPHLKTPVLAELKKKEAVSA